MASGGGLEIVFVHIAEGDDDIAACGYIGEVAGTAPADPDGGDLEFAIEVLSPDDGRSREGSGGSAEKAAAGKRASRGIGRGHAVIMDNPWPCGQLLFHPHERSGQDLCSRQKVCLFVRFRPPPGRYRVSARRVFLCR
jgi:hypothetical protein